MPRSLKEHEYIWAVTYTSRDDGHRLTAGYFTDQDKADHFCRTRAWGDDQRVVQTTLMKDESSGRFFKVETTEVDVDSHVHRAAALEKLSPEERRSLGV